MIGAGVEGVRMVGAGVGKNGAPVLSVGIGMHVWYASALAHRLTKPHREP
jgi:hypothetical protein